MVLTALITLTAIFRSCSEKRLVLTIEPNDYITKLGAGGSIKLYVKGKVTETGQSFAMQKDVELTKPVLKVTVSQSGDRNSYLLSIHISVIQKNA